MRRMLFLVLFSMMLSFAVGLPASQNANSSDVPPLQVQPESSAELPPMNITIPPLNLSAMGGNCTDSSRIGRPDYTQFNASFREINEPDYIAPVDDDCDIIAMEGNVTAGLAQWLATLDAIEAGMNSTIAQSGALLQAGNESLACLPVLAEDPAHMGALDIDISASESDLTPMYRPAPMNRQAKTAIINFYAAIECAHNARNYSYASFRTTESLSESLEGLCSGRMCMLEKRKEHYLSMLEDGHDKTLDYADDEIGCINDARGFAEEFNMFMSGLNRAQCAELAPLEVARLNATLSVLEIKKRFPGAENITFVPGKQPTYVVKAKERKKLLGIFDVELETSTQVDAVNGAVLSEEKPWWSFLVS